MHQHDSFKLVASRSVDGAHYGGVSGKAGPRFGAASMQFVRTPISCVRLARYSNHTPTSSLVPPLSIVSFAIVVVEKGPRQSLLHSALARNRRKVAGVVWLWLSAVAHAGPLRGHISWDAPNVSTRLLRRAESAVDYRRNFHCLLSLTSPLALSYALGTRSLPYNNVNNQRLHRWFVRQPSHLRHGQTTGTILKKKKDRAICLAESRHSARTTALRDDRAPNIRVRGILARKKRVFGWKSPWAWRMRTQSRLLRR